ncbi:transcription-repair coupling factor [Bartonella sp. DGB2]|uniref:transcription-repair coupling factor n=1 Tax=Bartonella sp. DGB2 TaxID=3388426 RepID=UPI0039901987
MKRFTLSGVVDGFEGFALAKLQAEIASDKPLIYVMRDGQKISDLQQVLSFVAPQLPLLQFPAWDCLPYDRVSPSPAISAQRMATFAALSHLRKAPHGALILTTANALIQKMPPLSAISEEIIAAKVGHPLKMEAVAHYLERNGFERVATVRDVGEFAIRGGLIDLFIPGDKTPLRLDFFGNNLESIRDFDPVSQRTLGQRENLVLQPMSEVTLTPAHISQFRRQYIKNFGAAKSEDTLYEAISEGRRFAGLEHWLPCFYEDMASFFDHTGPANIVFEHLVVESLNERYKLIVDYYDARSEQKNLKTSVGTYHPLPPDCLYFKPDIILEESYKAPVWIDFTPFTAPEREGQLIVATGITKTRNFSIERQMEDTNVFSSVVDYLDQLRAKGKKLLLAGWSEGSLERLLQVLEDHGLKKFSLAKNLQTVKATPRDRISAAVLNIEHGFETSDLSIIAEQDILGDRLIRRSKQRKRDADFISEINSLNAGDIVVHINHGIGRFVGLKTISAVGIVRDCLELHYAGDDRLFLPVENIELLSRYGAEGAGVALDKLGGVAWQARKAKLKKRLLEIAGQLIHIAAERAMLTAPRLIPPAGSYDEFIARFPYEETEDQLRAIDSVLEDLAAGKPMDRLICGDVGFGKTEVAIRAAFVAAFSGYQVAVVVPTTLLARQHYKTFSARFQGLPVKIGQASRLVNAATLNATKEGVADGTLDIVIGTHALLTNSVQFARLGLLIIDEEQHFGVKHKERLKELKSDVHVLTLSATPIPRTLQLALTGVRELSLITTPPVDRMAVRTFIAPFDPLVVRETLLREHYRGGQSFYVCPRISDLSEIGEFLATEVPELKVATAHGKMLPTQLDDIMNAFYEGKYDVLLSTTIVESGLDIPTANTMIIHRADMFGLAALYQLRGRVGRSKQRAYALFTLPANRILNRVADRRLKVMQSLDTLGAGFQLASHDMDIRGAGNFLGEEQSGHIKEVGFSLYQQMLEEAVAERRGMLEADDGHWSPQISVASVVMIPETYIPDLPLRMGLYRRLSTLETFSEIDAFGAELVDRFGPLPSEIKNLLKVIYIKALCKKSNVEKLDAGPKAVVIQFRDNKFANSTGLLHWLAEQGSMAKIRPDQSIAFIRDWPEPEQRLNGAAALMTNLAKLADSAAL